MKTLNRILCAGIATSMVVSVMPTTVFAEETPVSSPAELIIDMVEMAAVDIESSTLQAAYDTVEGLVTVNSDQVYYDGISIGYWYADAPTNIYKDAERTSTALTITDGAYIVDPVLLSNIMNDFNNQLVESYVPTTADWSKIIGKYDVTLGDIAIPASNWVSMTPSEDAGTTANLDNVSSRVGAVWGDGSYTVVQSYIISNDGNLYLNSGLEGATSSITKITYRNFDIWGSADTSSAPYVMNGTSSALLDSSATYYLYVGCELSDSGIPQISKYVGTQTLSESYEVPMSSLSTVYYNVSNPTQLYDVSFGVKECGYIYYYQEGTTVSQLHALGNISMITGNQPAFASASRGKLQAYWEKQSSSKVVNGNTQLTQRLSKLAQLELTDTISLTADGWSVNGTEDLDFYVGATSMSEAGSTTDIAALADVEAMVFNVVVPSTLPIYVDEYGKVSVADNAIVQNLSCASVVITEVKINESQSSDWTLVDTNPSPNRDANEFTFTTTLREGIVLAKDEVLSFTYGAELSPVTSGAVALDLATVSVTVDWAPVDNP